MYFMIILYISLNFIFINGFKFGIVVVCCNFFCFLRKGRVWEVIFLLCLNCLFIVGCFVLVVCRIVIIVLFFKKKIIVLIGIKILFILIKCGDIIE